MANTELRGIEAVIFDMDGTLVDSEVLTEPVVRALCDERGLSAPDLHWPDLYGVAWPDVARRLLRECPGLGTVTEIVARLHALYVSANERDPPPEIPGARETVMAAHARMPTAIVSSSFRESIEATMRRLDLEDFVSFYAGAEDHTCHKPAPDGFLAAAARLQVAPANCLVFEDSFVGLEAARAAGMRAVAIMHRSADAGRARALADLAVVNFSELGADFIRDVGQRGT